MYPLVDRVARFTQSGTVLRMRTDLALLHSSYREAVRRRLDLYTEPADPEYLQAAGDQLTMRHRLHMYSA